MKSSVKIIDKGWNRIKNEYKKLNGAYVALGFPSEDSNQHAATNFGIAELAAVHEYGRKDGSIPSRPFMRQTFDKYIDAALKIRDVLYNKVLQNSLQLNKP